MTRKHLSELLRQCLTNSKKTVTCREATRIWQITLLSGQGDQLDLHSSRRTPTTVVPPDLHLCLKQAANLIMKDLCMFTEAKRCSYPKLNVNFVYFNGCTTFLS